MPKILLPAAALAALSFTSLTRPVAPLAKERDLATLFPDSTALFLEGPGLSALLDEGFEHALVAEILRSPLGQTFGGAEGLRATLAFADAVVGHEILPTLAALSSRGVALGVAPRGNQAAWALVMHGDDDDRLADVLQKVLDHVGDEAGYPNAFQSPHDRIRGAEVWHIGEDLIVARRDGLLVASNEGGYGRDILDLAAEADATGLAGRDAFRDSRPNSDGVLVSSWLDLERIRDLPYGGGEGLRDLARLPKEPAAQFLLGPDLAGLGGAKRLSAWSEAHGEGLSVGIRGHEPADLDLLRARRAAPRPPLPEPNGDDVAVAHLYRDLSGVFEHRAELFEPEVLPSITKPISELAVLFGGRDLSESVLPGVSPWMTVVSRRVDFANAAQPDIQHRS